MNKYHCTDAGRDGCPCQLGVYGKCLVCPRIGNSAAIPQGCNDCGWQGTCISTLFHQSLQQPASVRFEQSLLIEDVKPYGADLKVFLVRADRGFCQRAKASGTYVFLRREGRDKWFDMPISILKSEPEKNLIHLAICGEGPKSKDASAAESGQHFIVRGIFTGGLTGLTEMAARSASTEVMLPVVVFAKGIAIAPLRNLLDDPRSGITADDLRLYVDLEKTGWDFFCDYFGDIPVSAVHIEDFREDGLAVSGESLRKRMFLR